MAVGFRDAEDWHWIYHHLIGQIITGFPAVRALFSLQPEI
jgi:uncharacterized membrane protein YesL